VRDENGEQAVPETGNEVRRVAGEVDDALVVSGVDRELCTAHGCERFTPVNSCSGARLSSKQSTCGRLHRTLGGSMGQVGTKSGAAGRHPSGDRRHYTAAAKVEEARAPTRRSVQSLFG